MAGAIYIDQTARDRISEAVWDEYLAAIPRYRGYAGTNIETDIRTRTRRMLDSFIDLANGDPQPDVAERLNFGAIAVNRLRQGFTLEDILRATRLEGRVLWTHISRIAPKSRLAEMGVAMLQLLEVTSMELENMYAVELGVLRASRDEATRIFLSRVLSDDFLAERLNDEAALIEYPGDELQTAVLIGFPGTTERAVPTSVAEDINRRVLPLLPQSMFAVPDRRMMIGVPSAIPEGVLNALSAQLTVALSKTGLRAGIGGTYAGLEGLRRSAREAGRASLIAGIIDSSRTVAIHSELRVYDIFRDGAPIDAFVRQVLGALLDHDDQKNTGLVATLREYYDTGFNRKLTASRLTIHVNTLDYRLQQISRIIESPGVTGFADFRVPLALKLIDQASIRG